MPTPLSRMKNVGTPFRALHPMTISAAARLRVYFNAFESRLSQTCFSNAGSPTVTNKVFFTAPGKNLNP